MSDYRIIVEPDEDEFHAYCPGLKGLHVGGKTEEEATRNAQDAAIAYVMSMEQHNEYIPPGLLNWVWTFASSRKTMEELFEGV